MALLKGRPNCVSKARETKKKKQDLFSKAGMGRGGQELGYKELCRPQQRVRTLCWGQQRAYSKHWQLIDTGGRENPEYFWCNHPGRWWFCLSGEGQQEEQVVLEGRRWSLKNGWRAYTWESDWVYIQFCHFSMCQTGQLIFIEYILCSVTLDRWLLSEPVFSLNKRVPST